jgi:hypothetical protein
MALRFARAGVVADTLPIHLASKCFRGGWGVLTCRNSSDHAPGEKVRDEIGTWEVAYYSGTGIDRVGLLPSFRGPGEMGGAGLLEQGNRRVLGRRMRDAKRGREEEDFG